MGLSRTNLYVNLRTVGSTRTILCAHSCAMELRRVILCVKLHTISSAKATLYANLIAMELPTAIFYTHLHTIGLTKAILYHMKSPWGAPLYVNLRWQTNTQTPKHTNTETHSHINMQMYKHDPKYSSIVGSGVGGMPRSAIPVEAAKRPSIRNEVYSTSIYIHIYRYIYIYIASCLYVCMFV